MAGLDADMAVVTLYPEVTVRDESGRFLAAVESGLAEAMAEIAELGKQHAQEIAPRGKKPDARGPSIVDGMYARWNGVSASWGSIAKHAMAQEMGARRHPITGQVGFFWEREGRWWTPGPNMIDHPGNPAQPFLRDSYEYMVSQVKDILARHLHGVG